MTSDVDKQQQSKNRRRSSEGEQAARGPERELRRFEPVPDALVLAAVERAERHGSESTRACR